MKKILFAFVLFSFFSCESENDEVEVGKKTTLSVNQIYDAGEVLKGEEIRAVFKVTNTGAYPLVFGEVRPSCSCTLANKPEKPLKPGASTEIVAKVNTAKVATKTITKSVTILTNTEPSTHVLLIKATIKQ